MYKCDQNHAQNHKHQLLNRRETQIARRASFSQLCHFNGELKFGELSPGKIFFPTSLSFLLALTGAAAHKSSPRIFTCIRTWQMTAGTPTAYTADGSVAGSFGRVVPRGRKPELLSLWGLRFFTSRVGRRISVLTLGSKGGAVLPSTPVVWRLVLSALLWPSCCANSLLWGRCFRRWCRGRGFAGRAGLQTSMRTAARWPWRQPSLHRTDQPPQHWKDSLTTTVNLGTKYCRPSRTHQVDKSVKMDYVRLT